MKYLLCLLSCFTLLCACQPTPRETPAPPAKAAATSDYLSYSAEDKAQAGIRLITLNTVKGPFKVWTKRVGNNPRIKVLLLHGGPGLSHEYFEVLDSYFPAAGIEYYYYDQLGSYNSDQTDHTELIDLPRYVEEVEQVRRALGLNADNFYLLGHSWGGLLGIEYALKYQQHLKGLIISNMMSSTASYNEYASKVIMPAMDQTVLTKIKALEAAQKYDDPEYMGLLIPHHYEKHFLRQPEKLWPDPVKRAMKHLNPKVYIPMQGPSELGASGKLLHWDRSKDLAKIAVPTLVIGARHDTMDPAHMKWMASAIARADYLYCPNGSHMAMYDDREVYMQGLIQFLLKVDRSSVITK